MNNNLYTVKMKERIMSFLMLMTLIAASSALVQRLHSGRIDLRRAMRHGMAGGFLFTGVDHFVHDTERYLPMMPPWFEPLSLELVWFTGAAELAGALGLLLPPALYRRLGLPDLRRAAGIGLALLLGCVVVANVHVALVGATVDGLPFGAWYYRLRPFLQPLIVLWALYAAGVIGVRRAPDPAPAR
ncbi:MAG TPA: DoxX family protein [Zeimonas sp.]|nr:DoxX family protein [Zeimonas sp.]